MHRTVYLLLTVISGTLCIEPGPTVIATKGEVWPRPQEIHYSDDYYTLRRPEFHFQITASNCSLVQNANDRYLSIIHKAFEKVQKIQTGTRKFGPYEESSDDYNGDMNVLEVSLTAPCSGDEYPHMDMDESYQLDIEERSILQANTVWGIIRGQETFTQLIYLNNNYNYVINATKIVDFPRFPYRGLLLDTSRHYLPVKVILENIEAMACNKLNVFHWHIVDDQSFPYQSIKYPKLSEMGAYHSQLMIYTQKDVKEIIEFARVRGIRVVPEFDTPGHTRSWGEGVEKILSKCYENGKPNGQYGPMNPTEPYLHTFVKDFFSEIIDVFPDEYLHLGGDEVDKECWKNNPEINKVMEKWNITGNYRRLENIYTEKLLEMIGTRKKALVWQEVFFNGPKLNKDTIVQIWDTLGYLLLNQVVSSGQPAIFSSCWYLNVINRGGDWKKFYLCEPYLLVAKKSRHLLKGGEVCMWGEYVNEYNVVPRIWPRASAAAEKLWSKRNADSLKGSARRLEEHACRMNSRGISAQPPNSAGFCLL